MSDMTRFLRTAAAAGLAALLLAPGSVHAQWTAASPGSDNIDVDPRFIDVGKIVSWHRNDYMRTNRPLCLHQYRQHKD